MHILMTGGTGFIGTALTSELIAAGHEVTVLTRQALETQGALSYVRDLEEIDNAAEIDAVINLAGASLAGRRWNAAYKREILDSRLDTTRDVLQLLRRLDSTPGTLQSHRAPTNHQSRVLRRDETPYAHLDNRTGAGIRHALAGR